MAYAVPRDPANTKMQPSVRALIKSERGAAGTPGAVMKVLHHSSVPLCFAGLMYVLEGLRLVVPFLPEVPGRARLGANSR